MIVTTHLLVHENNLCLMRVMFLTTRNWVTCIIYILHCGACTTTSISPLLFKYSYGIFYTHVTGCSIPSIPSGQACLTAVWLDWVCVVSPGLHWSVALKEGGTNSLENWHWLLCWWRPVMPPTNDLTDGRLLQLLTQRKIGLFPVCETFA
jgi:hypothetical protein